MVLSWRCMKQCKNHCVLKHSAWGERMSNFSAHKSFVSHWSPCSTEPWLLWLPLKSLGKPEAAPLTCSWMVPVRSEAVAQARVVRQKQRSDNCSDGQAFVGGCSGQKAGKVASVPGVGWAEWTCEGAQCTHWQVTDRTRRAENKDLLH